MLGSIVSNTQASANSGFAGVGSIVGGNSATRQAQSSGSDSLALTPWLLVTFIALYLVWAALEQHQRIKEAVSPSNIAINARNILFVGFTAIVGIVWLKIAMTKLTAWGVPGAAAVAKVVAAA